MPKYAFHHIHLASKDPHKSADFYEKSLGAKKTGPRKMADGRMTMDIDLNGTPLIITEARSKAMAPGISLVGLEHFGITTDNLEASVAELKAAGARFVQEITQLRPDLRIAFFVSPDNTLVELLEFKR